MHKDQTKSNGRGLLARLLLSQGQVSGKVAIARLVEGKAPDKNAAADRGHDIGTVLDLDAARGRRVRIPSFQGRKV